MSSDAAIARHAFRDVWVGATAWAFVFGATAAASAVSYVSSFPTAADRHELALTTGKDSGLAVLLGPITSIDTVGGYTVYKGFVFLTTIGAIWAVLAATRVLRREEDAGRWHMLLAGATRPSRATAAAASALVAGIAIVFVGTTACVMLAALNHDVGFGIGATLTYGASIVVAPAIFAGVGAVTSQLGRTRRVATGLGLAVFGICFVVRMVADSGPHTRWLLWASPFGWIELMRPFTHDDLWPLVPAALTVLGLFGAAIALAARRDVGAGVLATRDVAPPRRFGLGSPSGLALRLELPVLLAWCTGAAAAALTFGIIAKLATGNVPDSLTNALDKYGVQGSFANQYFGITFLLVAALVAMLGAAQIGAAAEEETSGRNVHLLVQPVRAATLFATRLAIAGAAIIVAGLVSGLGAWAGARTQGVDLGLGSMVRAGLNVVPTALVALGIGALVLAFAPRRAAAAVYGVVVWSLVVGLVGPLVANLNWLDRVSLFHYMARAPAENPDPVTLALTTAIAVIAGAAATYVFAHRDMQLA